MSSFQLAWLNLSRHRVSTFLALLSISISVACGGILLRLNQVSEERFSTFGRGPEAIVGAKAGGIEMLLGALNGEGDYPGFLPYSLFESLRAQSTLRFEDGVQASASSIRSITPFLYFGRFSSFRVVGTDETFFKQWKSGEQLTFESGSWTGRPVDVVLGSWVARVEGLRVGDRLSVIPWAGAGKNGNPIQMNVSGILKESKSSWDRMIFGDLVAAQSVLSSFNLSQSSIWNSKVLNYFLVDLEPGGFDSMASLVNRRTVGQAIWVNHEKLKLRELAGTGKNLGFFVTILVLILGGLTVTSLLITRFDAMALQFAVLRAIGYRKGVIVRWLLWEGVILGVGACLLGAILDGIGFPFMRDLLGTSLPPTEMVPSYLWQSAPIWLTALLATTLAVFLPVFRAYRQDVHFSLRN